MRKLLMTTNCVLVLVLILLAGIGIWLYRNNVEYPANIIEKSSENTTEENKKIDEIMATVDNTATVTQKEAEETLFSSIGTEWVTEETIVQTTSQAKDNAGEKEDSFIVSTNPTKSESAAPEKTDPTETESDEQETTIPTETKSSYMTELG